MNRRRARRGYTLVALTIAITIMLIMIAAVLPLASTQLQREREEELIFRGRQYAEGIRCFRRKYGRYPTSLKEMFETRPRTLRKLWKDPITNSNDWGLVTLGTLNPIAPVPIQGGPGGSTNAGGSFGGGSFGGGSFGGGTFGGGSSGGKGGFGGAPSPTPAPAPTPDPFGGATDGGSGFGSGSTSGGTGFGSGSTSGGSGFGSGSTSGGSGFGQGPGQQPPQPIMGVFSKSTKKSIRVYMGRDTYDGWKFTEQTLMVGGTTANDTPGGLPGPGLGGGPQPVPGPVGPPGGGLKP